MAIRSFLQAPIALALPLAVLSAQGAGAASVTGVVFDSLARAPLPNAAVQLASQPGTPDLGRTVVSDARGRFTFADVPDGAYLIGFLHPFLDSLGVELPPRRITVARGRDVRADLAVPSARQMRTAICGGSGRSGEAVIAGVVRDARGRAPVAGAQVEAAWLELALVRGGALRNVARLNATTNELGWFALCGVPRPGSVSLRADRGADSTDVIEVQVPAEGFLRRELYLGAMRTVVLEDTAVVPDSLAIGRARRRSGEGRLRGTVVFGEAALPLPGAIVRVADGTPVRSNARGEFMITDAPEGTRLLEVRAVGYYPGRLAVDVVDGGAPLQVALSSLRAVLDTVLVTAPYPTDRDRAGFAERRRQGLGRFMTSDEIARRRYWNTSEIFRNWMGIRLERDSEGGTTLLMRGMGGERCAPAIYVNGSWMNGIDTDALDLFIRPESIAGVEVYSGTYVPAQFQPGLYGCGSIVFWTK